MGCKIAFNNCGNENSSHFQGERKNGKKLYVFQEDTDSYKASVLTVAPNFGFGKEIGIAHAVETTGGTTLRISGYPAITPNGFVGEGDVGAQMTQALENVRRTLERVGATIDDIVHYVFYFIDREKFWNEGVPARAAFFQKYSKTKSPGCVTSVEVAGLMTPAMMIEVDVTAVYDKK